MKETKRRLIKDVASKVGQLPDDKQQYILGVMDGIMISCRNKRTDASEENDKSETGKE